MLFLSTRDSARKVSGAEAIVQGISEKDGGLFVPSSFPKLSLHDIVEMLTMDYAEKTAFILSKFLDDFSYDELLEYCGEAYGKFYDPDVAPVVKADDLTYVLELFHGPTCAFKDFALTLLPYLVAAAKKKTGDSGTTLVLTATSGDTGKAALEGFRDAEGVKIMVFYPDEGVSDMQKLQMITQEGGNVQVFAVKGNFDDAQTAVKEVFGDSELIEELKKSGVSLSSANSINIGRLLPQIAYYFSAYTELIASEEIEIGDKVNFCVPTGNFGNILAAYYAKNMGLPIGKLICASNINNVLTAFFNEGRYDRNRAFKKTISPSMDILISSNLERFVFELSGRNAALTAERMKELKAKGKYVLSLRETAEMQKDFYAGYAEEGETLETIDIFFDENDYLADPHTAVAVSVYYDYVAETGDEKPTVVVGTASPFKFAGDVLKALGSSAGDSVDKTLKKLSRITSVEIPEPLENLGDKEIRFTDVIGINDVKAAVKKFALED